MDKIKRIETQVVLAGRRSNQAWFAPALAAVPGAGDGGGPEVMVGAMLLTGNDMGPALWTRTRDLGRTWTPPMQSQNLLGEPISRERKAAAAQYARTMFGEGRAISPDYDIFEKPYIGPYYHRASKTLLGLGCSVYTRDDDRDPGQKGEEHVAGFAHVPVWTRWDPGRGDFVPWKRMAQPPTLETGQSVFFVSCSQWHECGDGTFLLPCSHLREDQSTTPGVTVVRGRFDGTEVRLVEHGSIHNVDSGRGLAEPSMTFFQGRYYLTIRHDERAYVTTSRDGLAYDALRVWTFDDGSELGNYNTQQHWLTREDGLYLVYNRRSELGNGVFRHRAPLFAAQVDPQRLCVIRKTERIILPEKGARMGNFGVVNVSDEETWIMTGEWLQQYVSGYRQGMPYWTDGGTQYNRIQYIGDLLLARVYFG